MHSLLSCLDNFQSSLQKQPCLTIDTTYFLPWKHCWQHHQETVCMPTVGPKAARQLRNLPGSHITTPSQPAPHQHLEVTTTMQAQHQIQNNFSDDDLPLAAYGHWEITNKHFSMHFKTIRIVIHTNAFQDHFGLSSSLTSFRTIKHLLTLNCFQDHMNSNHN